MHQSRAGAVARLFVSYRTDDSAHATIAITNRLADHFGAGNVFRDRDSLHLGMLYPRRIRRALEQADVVIAVIGPAWLDARDGRGARRLDDPGDWVRTELRMAFEREIPVVPLLLDHVPLPQRTELPPDIALLSLSTYWQVRRKSFDSDIRGLITGIDRSRAASPTAPPTAPARPVERGNVQHNTSYGGPLIANQGGRQVIHWADACRDER